MAEKRVWLYSRIAHGGPEHMKFLLAQQYLLERYAKDHGYVVVDSSADILGGLTLDRPGLHRFQAAVEQAEVDAILIVDLSRLGRDMARVTDFWQMLRGFDVTIQTVQDGEINLELYGRLRAEAEK